MCMLVIDQFNIGVKMHINFDFYAPPHNLLILSRVPALFYMSPGRTICKLLRQNEYDMTATVQDRTSARSKLSSYILFGLWQGTISISRIRSRLVYLTLTLYASVRLFQC